MGFEKKENANVRASISEASGKLGQPVPNAEAQIAALTERLKKAEKNRLSLNFRGESDFVQHDLF